MIKIIAVGRIKEKALQSCINEYLKRLSAFSKIEIVEVEDIQAPQSYSQAQNEQVKIKEGERTLSRIKDTDYVILLDLQGHTMNSLELAKKMQEIQTYRTPDICFVIGGSLGLAQSLINRANERLQISLMTFPHQLVRLILLEQIYRCYKINNNEPYHK